MYNLNSELQWRGCWQRNPEDALRPSRTAAAGSSGPCEAWPFRLAVRTPPPPLVGLSIGSAAGQRASRMAASAARSPGESPSQPRPGAGGQRSPRVARAGPARGRCCCLWSGAPGRRSFCALRGNAGPWAPTPAVVHLVGLHRSLREVSASVSSLSLFPRLVSLVPAILQ